MRRVDCLVDDLLYLCRRMRQDEVDQYTALSGYADFDYRRAALDFINQPGIKFTLLDDDDVPVCAGGYNEVSIGVWQSWMVGADAGWTKHWRSITRHSREVMTLLFEHGAHRLQTNALADRVLARRWYEKGLGLNHEGTLRRYTPDGRDLVVYAKIKEG